ncbi:MAG: VWA domain-containing protein [Gammaproteobacteria bacterium]|nr:VWA domain-containing protein [Gammaproteobacteria bacterium]
MTGFSWDILQIREPWWLLLAAQPLIVMLFLRLQSSHKNNDYADTELLPWVIATPDADVVRRSRIHFILMQSVWLLFAVAMAGPRYPDPPQAVDHSSGVDVMVLLDVSRSMTATDIKPSRLKRAKAELYQILSLNKSDRLGIILYAGRPHVMSPLTWDRNALQFYVNGIRKNLMPTEGSDIEAAIRLANKHLQHSTNKAIIVLTDGELNRQIKIDEDLLQSPLFIMGVGTYEGTSIPDAETGWLMVDQQVVRTRLEEGILKELALRSGGSYATMTDDMTDLDKLYLQGINRIAGEEITDANDKQAWVELYPWFILSACLLLLLVTIDWVRLFSGKPLLLTVVLLAGLMPADESYAEIISPEKQLDAFELFTGKDYQAALDIYSLSTGFIARMGEGASSYQMKDYASAITQFTQAFLIADTDTRRANALYNLGNSFFMIKRYDASLTTFEDVLRYRSDHVDAKANKEFVSSLLASLMEDPFYDPGKGRSGGRGPRSARLSENAGGSGDFSLGEEEKKEQTNYSETGQNSDALAAIAIRGKQAVVADSSINKQDRRQHRTVTAVDLLEARRIVLQSKQDQSLLWKSLFEDEEGFPAPLDKPVVLPGVAPW